MGAWCWSDNFLPWFAEQGYDVHAISLRNHAGSEKKVLCVSSRLKNMPMISARL